MSVEPVACANHPFRKTVLHCNRCGKPICTKCIVRTPVGYRCKQCIEEQQEVYSTARWYDYVSAFLASGLITGGFGLLTSFLCCFIIPAAPIIAGAVVGAAKWATANRWSHNLQWAVIAGAFSGGIFLTLLILSVNLIFTLFNWDVSNFGILSIKDTSFVIASFLVTDILYTIACTIAVYFYIIRHR